MYKNVLPASMSVYHMHAVPTEARGGASDLSELELQNIWASIWVLGIEPGPLEEQPILQSWQDSIKETEESLFPTETNKWRRETPAESLHGCQL